MSFFGILFYMKSLLVIIIIIAMGYFAYEAFQGSDVIITEDTSYEEQLREEFGDDTPITSREAIRQVNAEGASFFNKIEAKIDLWQIQINTFINEKL